MADTVVEAAVSGAAGSRAVVWGPYYISPTRAMEVYGDVAESLVFRLTVNAGVTWAKTTIQSGINLKRMGVHFDQETPGDTGTLLHISYFDLTSNEARYVTVDISDGTIGTIRLIDSGITVGGGNSDNRMDITKTRNGNLIVAFSTQSEIECYRSVDAGVTWVDRADVFETATEEDYAILFPANTGDDADAAAFFWDRDGDGISVKMYDDSANTWTETSILTGMADDATDISMDGSTRHSDGFLLGFAHSDEDAATDDLRTWTVNPNSIASPAVVIKTNIFDNQDESGMGCMLINQQNDFVYVAYIKGGIFKATTDVVFHISTDGMTTWGAEQAYSEGAPDDIRVVQAGRTIGNGGGFFQPIWDNDDLEDLLVNLVNDVFINSVQNIPVGQATETDLAQPITPIVTQTIPVAQATEIDLAQVITATLQMTIPFGQASEINLAQMMFFPVTIADAGLVFIRILLFDVANVVPVEFVTVDAPGVVRVREAFGTLTPIQNVVPVRETLETPRVKVLLA